MTLDSRLLKLEALLSPQEPAPWTTWTQSEDDPDIFHCTAGPEEERGTAAHRPDLEDRPRVVLVEHIDDYDGTGQPATIMHFPTGLTRVYANVGRGEPPEL